MQQDKRSIAETPEWKALEAHWDEMCCLHMREIFEKDLTRCERFSLSACGLHLDYSKNLIDDKVDFLYKEIVAYLGKVGSKSLTDSQADELSSLLSAVNDLESIGDIIETDVVDMAEQCFSNDVHISEATQSVLGGLHTTIAGSVERALHSVAKSDAAAAEGVISMKNAVQAEVATAEQHQAQRLLADAPNRIATYSVEMEMIEKLKRIYYFAKRMAKSAVTDDAEMVNQPA